MCLDVLICFCQGPTKREGDSYGYRVQVELFTHHGHKQKYLVEHASCEAERLNLDTWFCS
jgi:hypothetical protein